jgi:Poxvirus A22 protein
MISFDVGIKNLAFCLFHENKIMKWGIIDLSDNVKEEKEKQTCSQCKCNAKMLKDSTFYCQRHIPTDSFIFTKPEFYQINVKELGLAEKHILETIPESLQDFKKKKTKQEYLEMLTKYRSNFCFPLKGEEKQNVGNISLIVLGKKMKEELDFIFSNIHIPLKTVIIENQMSPIASRMKTIQGMLTQYFIQTFPLLSNIEFVSAKLKLGNYISSGYKDRKKKSIEICRDLLTESGQPEFLDYFNKEKKKDDLADSFLQGVFYIEKQTKQTKQNSF